MNEDTGVLMTSYLLLTTVSNYLLEVTNQHESCFHDLNQVTHGTIRVFRYVVREYPRAVMLKEIALDLHVTPGTVTKMVETLIGYGLMVRKTNSEDRRSSVLSLSDAAVAILKRRRKFIAELMERLLAGIPEESRKTFFEVFAALFRNLDREHSIAVGMPAVNGISKEKARLAAKRRKAGGAGRSSGAAPRGSAKSGSLFL